jgi:hypothetical protein
VEGAGAAPWEGPEPIPEPVPESVFVGAGAEVASFPGACVAVALWAGAGLVAAGACAAVLGVVVSAVPVEVDDPAAEALLAGRELACGL